MIERLFIYNNLKVSPFLPYDKPFPGCELLTYDNESYTIGTLWDLGLDAGYSRIGFNKVYGQVWVVHTETALNEFLDFSCKNLFETSKIPVTISMDLIQSKIEAVTLTLKKIDTSKDIVKDGYWQIKRQ